jgi:molecular chaperone HscA
MLQDGFSHATEDRDARSLGEQRVEADRTLVALEAALAADGSLLEPAERSELVAAMARVREASAGSDLRGLKAAIAALNHASEGFAGRRMDRAIAGALAGRRVEDVGGE